jgi:hypothetical protein
MKQPRHPCFEILGSKIGSGFAGLLAALALSVAAHAAEPAPESTADLVKKSANPLARVYNLSLTGNVNFQKGTYERTQSALNLGATVPFDLPANWNLFINGILPTISQPIGPDSRTVGLGDLTVTALIAPPVMSGWTVAFGPSIVAPTASDATLGQGKWEVGPALAAVYLQRTWVAGVLAYQNWSVTGASSSRPGVSRLTITPFLTWYINKGWYLTSAPIISADWNQDPPRVWTVPVGGGVGHIVRRGKHAFNFTAHAYVNVERPDGAAKWQFRLTTSWVFPR